MKTKDKRRQIKREKIVDALSKANYSVQDWFIDLSTNSCLFFHVRNDINNLDMICYIPQNILLVADTGSYLTKIDPTPDFESAQSVWNECPLETLSIFIHDGLIVKRPGSIWEYYNITKERPRTNDLEMIHQLSSEMTALNEDIVEIVENSGSEKTAIEIVTDEINPFDILIDGGDVKVEESRRVEECQPTVLINYKGFTYGQAIPFINIIDFMNSIKGFEVTLSNKSKQILEYQNAKIKRNGEEAVEILEKFLESLKGSLKEWDDEWASSSELLNRIQSILETSYKKGYNMNDVPTRANQALKETQEKLIEKRDNLLGFLVHVKGLFGEV